MKDQLSLTVLWIAPALVVLAFATAGHPPSFLIHQSNLSGIAEANASPKNETTCGDMITGQYSNLHHGWGLFDRTRIRPATMKSWH